jgi:hypothetical protein
VAVAPVEGTPYGLAVVGLPPVTNGPAGASLPLGMVSVFASLLVLCFGAVGANRGWGPAVAGAFALPSLFAGVAAVTLGQVGLRRATRWAGQVGGRGVAISGLVFGIVGLVLDALFFLVALALAAA